MLKFTKLFVLALALAAASLPALAQCHSGSDDSAVAASPSQPVVTDSPDPINLGVAEVEYGWQHASLGDRTDDTAFGALYKLGVFCNAEVRVFFNPWLHNTLPGQSPEQGIGDTWITGQYRFHAQTHYVPSLAFHYTFKQPTANSADGLGSGQHDQILAVSAGKDYKQTTFNFETKYIFLGQPNAQPFSRFQQYSGNATHALVRHFSLTGEIYANTRSTTQCPGLASTLWTVNYSRNPRLVFDAGIDVGLTHGAPDKRFFAGVSYALGDFYKPLRHLHSSSD